MAKDLISVNQNGLTPAQFGELADVPPELEWLANITNPKTRRAYQNDVAEFFAFAGLRELGRAAHRHPRRTSSPGARTSRRAQLAPSSIRRKLSALSSLFDYLCERNAVAGNPVDGVKRPMANGNEGSTPALGDAQARKLLDAPPDDTLKGKRDRAILATLLYHGIRREELCRLRVKDMQSRQGVLHFRVKGKRDKIRFVPVHAAAQRLIEEYLALAGHGADTAGPLFRPVKNNRTRQARPAARSRLRLSEHRAEIRPGHRHQRRSEWAMRPFPARHGRYQCPLPRGRYRQGPGMARPRQRLHHAAL